MRAPLRWLGSAAAAVVTVGATSWLPHLVGSTWTAIAHQLGQVGLVPLVVVGVLWFAGLAAYTIAVVASLPGLSARRALALNLAGSSAANLIPFGGVVGTGINAAMIRSWRLPMRPFASSVAVLNLANLFGKLILPVVGGAIVAHDLGVGSTLGQSALWTGAALAALCAAGVAAVVSSAWARMLDRGWRRVRHARSTRRTLSTLSTLSTGNRSAADVGPGPAERLHLDVRATLHRSWGRLTAGMSAYVVLQFLLFAFCLHLSGVGAPVGIGGVFAAFAAERAVTLVVVTPAGAGLAEASAAGLLVALGASPISAAAGVVLYRLFVFGAEIPVGAAVLAGWAWRRPHREAAVAA